MFSKTKDSSASIAQLDVLKFKSNLINPIAFTVVFISLLLEMVQRAKLEMGVKHRRLLSSLGRTLSRHLAWYEVWTLLIHFAFNMWLHAQQAGNQARAGRKSGKPSLRVCSLNQHWNHILLSLHVENMYTYFNQGCFFLMLLAFYSIVFNRTCSSWAKDH